MRAPSRPGDALLLGFGLGILVVNLISAATYPAGSTYDETHVRMRAGGIVFGAAAVTIALVS